MNISRTLAVAAASLVAISGAIAPAQAQELNLGDLAGGAGAINQFVDNFPCEGLNPLLSSSGLVDDQTTRSELAAALRTEAGLKTLGAEFQLIGTLYAGRIADRALECGAVQPDPQQDILTQLQNFSSNLSS